MKPARPEQFPARKRIAVFFPQNDVAVFIVLRIVVNRAGSGRVRCPSVFELEPAARLHATVVLELIPSAANLLNADDHESLLLGVEPIPAALGKPARLQRARRPRIHPTVVARHPTSFHGPAVVECIPRAAYFFTTRRHNARTREVIPRFALQNPARLHGSRAAEQKPLIVNLLPTRKHFPVFSEKVPRAINPRPAVRHSARAVEPIPGAKATQPTRLHHARRVREIPGAAIVHPAGAHVTSLRIEVIPRPTDKRPARSHYAIRRGILPCSIENVPARIHIARRIEAVKSTVYLQDATRWVAAIVIGIPPSSAVALPRSGKRDSIVFAFHDGERHACLKAGIIAKASDEHRSLAGNDVILIRNGVVKAFDKQPLAIAHRDLRGNRDAGIFSRSALQLA